MKWYEKFKVGERVRVINKVPCWRLEGRTGGCNSRGADWNSEMDRTIGKVFRIEFIDLDIGYRLETDKVTSSKYNYWYPVQALAKIKGEQLLFDFMR